MIVTIATGDRWDRTEIYLSERLDAGFFFSESSDHSSHMETSLRVPDMHKNASFQALAKIYKIIYNFGLQWVEKLYWAGH